MRAFLTEAFNYQSHIYGRRSSEVVSEARDVGRCLTCSTNVSKLRSYYSYVLSSEDISRTLPAYTHNWTWAYKRVPTVNREMTVREKSAAFRSEDRRATTAMLALPQRQWKWAVKTDVLHERLDEVVLQEQLDGPLRPIDYWACSPNPIDYSDITTKRV